MTVLSTMSLIMGWVQLLTLLFYLIGYMLDSMKLDCARSQIFLFPSGPVLFYFIRIVTFT
jgi:hypothetical protein